MQLDTQHTAQAFGFASMASLVEMRGGSSIKSGQHPITESIHTVTAGGFRHRYYRGEGGVNVRGSNYSDSLLRCAFKAL